VYAREFAVFVEAGIAPMDAIHAEPACRGLLDWQDRLGKLGRASSPTSSRCREDPPADISALSACRW
jgi:hypothetical protein